MPNNLHALYRQRAEWGLSVEQHPGNPGILADYQQLCADIRREEKLWRRTPSDYNYDWCSLCGIKVRDITTLQHGVCGACLADTPSHSS